jgi:hypothetical protein
MTDINEKKGGEKGFRYGPDFYIERDYLRVLDEMLDKAAEERGKVRRDLFGPRGAVFNLGRFLRSYECQYGASFFVPKATLRSLFDCKDKVIQRVHAGLKWGGFIQGIKSRPATFPDDYGNDITGPAFFYELTPTRALLRRIAEKVSSDHLQGSLKRSVLTIGKVSSDHLKNFVWSVLTKKLENLPKKRKSNRSAKPQAYIDRLTRQKEKDLNRRRS